MLTTLSEKGEFSVVCDCATVLEILLHSNHLVTFLI